MKATLLTLALGGLLSMSAQAVIVTIESAFDKAVTTSGGTAIADGTGFVGVGFFSSVADVDLATTSSADLETAFQVFGSTGTFGFGGFGGVYQVESDGGRVAPGSTFATQPIYTILGNGATIGSSSEFVIYKHALTFEVDNADANPKAFNATLGVGGDYLMGAPTGNNINVGGFDFPQVAMAVAVPEPSVAILGALGIFGLVRRRR